jgi:hypothetical protein
MRAKTSFSSRRTPAKKPWKRNVPSWSKEHTLGRRSTAFWKLRRLHIPSCVVRCCPCQSGYSETEQFEDAISQMVRVIYSFESLVATLSQAETERQSRQATASTVVGLETQRELSLQLRHMVVNAHWIYSAFTIGFRRLQNGQRRLQNGQLGRRPIQSFCSPHILC